MIIRLSWIGYSREHQPSTDATIGGQEQAHFDCLQLEGGELAGVQSAIGRIRSARDGGRGRAADLCSLGLALLDLLLDLCLYLLDGVGRGALQVVVAACRDNAGTELRTGSRSKSAVTNQSKRPLQTGATHKVGGKVA